MGARKKKKWKSKAVLDLVRELIWDLAPSPSEIVRNARLIEDLGYHSLSLLELAFSLEDEFELLEIDEETARLILTVGDIENHVINALKEDNLLAA